MKQEDALKVAALGLVVTGILTSETVKTGLNDLEKNLKSNGHDTAGWFVEKAKKFVGNLGNVTHASPGVPRVPLFSSKLTYDEALHTFKKGDQIATDRKLHFSHHGIYEGYDSVIEYDGNRIKRTTLDKFLGSSHYLYRVDSEAKYSPDEIVRRAKSRIGENKYGLIGNNCDQFARWCRNDY